MAFLEINLSVVGDRAASNALTNLATRFKDIGKAAESLDVINDSIEGVAGRVTGAIDKLTGMVGAIGGVVAAGVGLDALGDVFGGIIDTVEGFVSASSQISGQLENIRSSVVDGGESLSGFSDQIKNLTGVTVESVDGLDRLIDEANRAPSAFAAIQEQVTRAQAAIGAALAPAIEQVGEVLTPVIQKFGELFGSLVARITETEAFSEFIARIGELLGFLAERLTEAGGPLETIFQAALPILQDVTSLIVDLSPLVLDLVGLVLNAAVPITRTLSAIVSALAPILRFVTLIFNVLVRLVALPFRPLLDLLGRASDLGGAPLVAGFQFQGPGRRELLGGGLRGNVGGVPPIGGQVLPPSRLGLISPFSGTDARLVAEGIFAQPQFPAANQGGGAQQVQAPIQVPVNVNMQGAEASVGFAIEGLRKVLVERLDTIRRDVEDQEMVLRNQVTFSAV